MKIQFSPEIDQSRNEYLAVKKAFKSFRFNYSEREESRRIANDLNDQMIIAHKKWNDLSLGEIQLATTKKAAIVAFRAAPWGMPAKFKALERLAELCGTLEDLRDAYRISCGQFKDDSNPTLQKWDMMSIVESHNATDIDEARKAYFRSPCLPVLMPSRIRAYEKWLSLCLTLAELEYAYRITDTHQWRGLEDLYDLRYEEVYAQTKKPPTRGLLKL